MPTSIPSLIEVVPELKLDGQVIHTGTSPKNLGEELMLFNQVHFPGRGATTRPLSVIVGSYMAIGSESGSISSLNLEKLRQKVEQTKSTIETQDPALIALLGREDILGDLFHAGIQGYYAQYTALSNLMGLKSDGQMMLMAGMGTFGYEPKVNTLFGFPRSISSGGMVLDIPIASVSVTDGLDTEEQRLYAQEVGMLSSALEFSILEQQFRASDFPLEAISAVKAFGIANAESQKIYLLNADNVAETFPNLQLDTETESEILQAIRAGKEVIAHTDRIEIPGWTGAGYVIWDPLTGSGAYKISGGLNGGASGDPGIVGFASAVVNQPNLLFPACSAPFLEQAFNNFINTNKAIVGLAAPFGLTFLTAGVVAKSINGMTVIEVVKLTFKSRIWLVGNLLSLLITAFINFALINFAFEVGLAIGSGISAAFCRRKGG